MPELAEVEFFRKVWNSGLRRKIASVSVHEKNRIFRGADLRHLARKLTGATLLASHAHGKQLLFHFSGDAWLAIHLGMTGKLLDEPAPYSAGQHDHLVFRLKERELIFRDPRQFGRVRFDEGKTKPDWWLALSPEVTSREFSAARVDAFLQSHRRAPLKSVLLLQDGFPGIGNWMADEILWQAGRHPTQPAGGLDDAEVRKLRQKIRHVATVSLRTIGRDFSDPPSTWLFHHRWEKKGTCPCCGSALKHSTIGGRTTCWCPKCQPESL